MDALSVITLEQAKEFLVVDFPDRDAEITRHIKSAISYVERYTNVILYERVKQYSLANCSLEIYDYPLSIVGSVNTFDRVIVSMQTFTGDDLIFDAAGGEYYLPLTLVGQQNAFAINVFYDGLITYQGQPLVLDGKIYNFAPGNENLKIQLFLIEGTNYTSLMDTVKYKQNILSTTVFGRSGDTIIANIGYSDVSQIPGDIIEGAYKIITYLFENRDIYSASLPWDIQMLLNPYRRSPTF